MPLCEANLSKCCPRVRPEIISPERHSGVDRINGLRLGAPAHSPVEIGQRESQPKDMSRTFRPPFALASVELRLPFVQELPKALKGRHSIRGKRNRFESERTVIAFCWKIDDPREGVLHRRLNLGHFVRQRPITGLVGPREENARAHSVSVAFERSG